MNGLKTMALAVLGALALAGAAQAQLPETKSETWTIKDFRFHDGSVLPEMKVHYLTVGDPRNPAVLVLHGTGRQATNMMDPGFGGVLFAPGGALDARRYFIVVPDAIGHGDSSKPSDGLRMRFPEYDYDDMVQAQYRLITERLGVKHLKLVIGASMGGMQAWLWGETHPDSMDMLVPMAAQPTQVTARNWIFRRMVIDLIKSDPEWNGGNYAQEPNSLGLALTYFGLLFSGGTRAQYAALPTWAATDKAVADALARKPAGDANDTIYQFAAARDYDPEPKLGQIKAPLLAINSADDERNPAELGITARLVKRVKAGRYYEIPTGPDTRGHGTVYTARLWEAEARKFLAGP
jgi:homoserine O-acetyltransferase